MDDRPKVDSLGRAVRTLAIAVGFLAAGVLALFALYAVSLYKSRAFFRGATSVSASSSRTTHAGGPPGVQDEKPFHSLAPEEKIKRSSAILLTKHEKDGGRIKAIVSEILKRPDAGLNYSVGDEFGDLSRYVEGDTDYGDGDVVFFVDGATDMREATTYRHGRISGLGDMPLDLLRAMIRGGGGAVPQPAVPSAGHEVSVMPLSSAGKQGPSIDLERTTNGEGVTRSFSIPRGAALDIPEWFPEKGEPPLKMTKAIQLATDAASAASPEHTPFVARSIRLQLVSCDEPVGNRWYYVLDCVPRQSGGLGMSQSVPIVVLMDGTVVTGTIKR
jgi:hypothetical protein